MDLRDKVVVVTGASAGVGRATAVAFAHAGAHVAVIARGRDGLEGACREIEAAGRRALALPLDVSDAAAVDAAASRVEEELGPIEVWVNAAMVTIFAPFHKIRPEEFRHATEVTYLGAVYGSMAALARMRPRKRGVLVQVGSALSYRAVPLQSVYCASKFAIRGFTDALRVELMHEDAGIHVTMVQLSAFNTPQFNWALSRMPKRAQPLPPIFQPEVAARGIVWAATHRRREVLVGFPAVKAIWGNKLLPQFADHLLAKKGYSGQLTDEPENPDRPHNLYEPLPGDHGAHGRFDNRARASSRQVWFTTHRMPATAVAVILVVGLAVGLAFGL
jgi:NAD(P)-dependent dehydrogenase (short-subunit alcohol dehydrogenase family)